MPFAAKRPAVVPARSPTQPRRAYALTDPAFSRAPVSTHPPRRARVCVCLLCSLVPDPAQMPLSLRLNNGSRAAWNAFFAPGWGGIAVHNLQGCVGGAAADAGSAAETMDTTVAFNAFMWYVVSPTPHPHHAHPTPHPTHVAINIAMRRAGWKPPLFCRPAACAPLGTSMVVVAKPARPSPHG